MNIESNIRLGKLFLILLHLVLLYVGFLAAYGVYEALSSTNDLLINHQLILITSLVAIVSFNLFDLYSSWKRKSIKNLVYSIVLALSTVCLINLGISWFSVVPLSSGLVLLAFAFQLFFVGGMHIPLWSIQKKNHGLKKVLIIGEDKGEDAGLAKKILKHQPGWFLVHGYTNVKNKNLTKSDLSVVDAVLISPSITEDKKAEMVQLISSNGKEIMVVPTFYNLLLTELKPEQIDDMLVYSLKPMVANKGTLQVKRLIDFVFSILIIIAASPIIIALFVLIPLTSRGPAIFKQERIGLHEKPYITYKFRSMVQDAEKLTGPVLASEHDPRITKLGRIMRALRLDELPQLFNVVKGDMSLVGPRPERDFFIKKFKKDIPEYEHRFAVKPGITGVAQVLANYTTTVEDKLRFDLMYVRNLSLMLDIKILFQTLRVVLQREQAKGVADAEIEETQKKIKVMEQH